MIDSFVTVQETKYQTVVRKIIKASSLYSCVVLCLGLCAMYESNKLEASKLLFRDIQSSVWSSSRQLAVVNTDTHKMQAFLHNAQLERRRDLSSHIKIFKHAINSFASRYKIVGPVKLNISLPRGYKENSASSINLEILVKAYNEDSIIRFIDSLVASHAGFMKIEKIAMAKPRLQQASSNRHASDLVSCKLGLSWHVLLTNKR